jgi:double-strand break repair protein MRE11
VVLQVQSMIQQAMRDSPAATQQQQQQALLPLIRLRVDYSGFSTINSQRFGQKFVGKVRPPV